MAWRLTLAGDEFISMVGVLLTDVVMKARIVSIFLALLPGVASAATITIDRDDSGPVYESKYGIRADTATRGRDLGGMVVTANFSDGTSEQVVWQSNRYTGRATGNSFDLFFSWQYFELDVNKSLTSLLLDAGAGNSVFDTTSAIHEEDGNTYSTKIGYYFYITGATDPDGDIAVTYSKKFTVAGHDEGDDAYLQMLVDFSGLSGGGLTDDIYFNSDLDTLAVAGDISSVPLPSASIGLLSLIGLMGFGIRNRAKRKS